MTIFYGGKMNVYNDVPVEKVNPPVHLDRPVGSFSVRVWLYAWFATGSYQARAIMQLASSPVAVGDLNDPPPEPVHARRTVHPRISIGPGPNGAFFASLPIGRWFSWLEFTLLGFFSLVTRLLDSLLLTVWSGSDVCGWGSGQPEWTSAREMEDTTNRGSTGNFQFIFLFFSHKIIVLYGCLNSEKPLS